MTKDEAMKRALEALEANVIGTSGRMPKTHEAITALREALAEQPAQRTWVGLTDEEILAVNMSTITKLIDEPIVCDTDHNIAQLGKAIEAKLRSKNT